MCTTPTDAEPSTLMKELTIFLSAFWGMRIWVTFMSVQITIFPSVTWLHRLGQMTSEIIADVHLIEQRYGLGEDIGLFSNKTYAKLSELDPKYKKCLAMMLPSIASLCNLGCIVYNGLSLSYMAAHLCTLKAILTSTGVQDLHGQNLRFGKRCISFSLCLTTEHA
ncbi:LOW QUALITY PROTEIN: transmembrane protein 205 [Macrochelys suwanniensis]